MRLKAYAYLVGVVAILAGLAVLAFSSSRVICIFGGAVLVGGMGAAGWASGGMSLRMFAGVLVATALIYGSLALAKLI
jgi:hypothetical protein